MKFCIDGWESFGLRCPDLSLSFSKGAITSAVSLIQMPNGTGKTTTLNLIRAALTGDARYWSPEEVDDLKRAHSNNPDGFFELKISVDDEPMTFRLNVDFLSGKINYETTYPSGGGHHDDWKPRPELLRFLRDKFIDLFIFNGELAEHLLDSNKSAAEDAIDALCQLDLLDEVQNKIESHWESQSKRAVGRSEHGLKMATTQVTRLEQKLNGGKLQLKKWNQKIEDLAKEITKLDNLIDSSTSKYEDTHKNMIDAENLELELTNKVAVGSINFMAALRFPETIHHRFAKGLQNLRTNLDTLKLPETTSRQFFEELKLEENCICDRPMNDDAIEAIDRQSSKYLGSDISGFLNSLKEDIEKFVSPLDYGQESPIFSHSHDLGGLSDDLHLATTKKENYNKELIKSGGAEVQDLAQKLEKAKSEKEELEFSRDLIQDSNNYDKDENKIYISIPILEKELAFARTKLAEISDTVELKNKVGIITEILVRSKKLARERIRNILIEDCNARLKNVLSGDPIQIQDIKESIHLMGQRGASVGQTLAVSYTFLTSILGRGQHKFPLLVDTPAGPLTKEVREEIGNFIPTLCHQFIGLTINTEYLGLVPALHKASGGDIEYFSVFRRTDNTKQLENDLPSDGVSKTETGVVVRGLDYFENFELTKQD